MGLDEKRLSLMLLYYLLLLGMGVDMNTHRAFLSCVEDSRNCACTTPLVRYVCAGPHNSFKFWILRGNDVACLPLAKGTPEKPVLERGLIAGVILGKLFIHCYMADVGPPLPVNAPCPLPIHRQCVVHTTIRVIR